MFQIGRRIGISVISCGVLLLAILLHQKGILSTSEAIATVTLEIAEHDQSSDINHAAPKRVKPKVKKPAYLPVVSQKDILVKHQQLADSVLKSVHAGCKDSLKNFYVRYDNPDQRGLGGGTTIILSGNVPDDEFRALLVHECGHLIDLTALKGTRASGLTSFRDGNEIMYMDDPSVSFYAISWIDSKTTNQSAKDADFVSGYAMWDAFEDFSETYAYYMLQRDAFLERAQKNPALWMKYQWMETHVPSQPIAIGTMWERDLPWDITKLPYLWTGLNRVAKQ